MENEPSPMNFFFQEKEKISTNNNIDYQKNIEESPITKKSNSNIKFSESLSNQELKKSNILFNNEINLDVSLSQEENINENDFLNILKSRFNENKYFTNINKNLIYLNSFCKEEDIFGKDIEMMYKNMNENENECEGNDSHIFQ